ncbi:MAG: hypothetical protein BMS9Abin37_2241 [Acidobacteriota bacterium]|nr:MAG: hypothetical protein BMS9Abin37_2241 [Acidobacteriota bacterium]
MAHGDFFRDESRTSPRFVPKEHLSMFLAGSASPLVHGDIKDLSELGACVRTDTALDRGGNVTINVRNGYSFLFRAEARIVWRSSTRRPRESFDCSHGILFTELSPFTRKLIRRLGGTKGGTVVPPAGAPIEGLIWDSDSDPDLQIMFRAERSPAEVDEDRLDLLTDPVLEAPLLAEHTEPTGVPELARESAPLRQPTELDVPGDDFDQYLDCRSLDPVEPIQWSDASETALAPKLAAIDSERHLSGDVELSGNLGYFDNTDVLQMLEATRATGVLYVKGPYTGEIQLLEGRICRCFSHGLTEEEAAFRLVVARRGRFHFIPCPVPASAQRVRTTTQLVLDAQLRRDRKK